MLSIDHALSRAWEIRAKIIQRVRGVPVSDNLVKIWEATLEDVQEGSCLGPFASPEEVTDARGQDDWIPTQRFEVVQKNKVRGCDSATTNLINQITEIKEKLQLPSTDTNVAAIRKLTQDLSLGQRASRLGARRAQGIQTSGYTTGSTKVFGHLSEVAQLGEACVLHHGRPLFWFGFCCV